MHLSQFCKNELQAQYSFTYQATLATHSNPSKMRPYTVWVCAQLLYLTPPPPPFFFFSLLIFSHAKTARGWCLMSWLWHRSLTSTTCPTVPDGGLQHTFVVSGRHKPLELCQPPCWRSVSRLSLIRWCVTNIDRLTNI